MKGLLRLRRVNVKVLLVLAIIFLAILLFTLSWRRQKSEESKQFQLPRSVTFDGDSNGSISFGKTRQVSCFLFVVILTSPYGSQKRKGIRETWLRLKSNAEHTINHKFVVGTAALGDEGRSALESEDEEFRDILMLPDLKDGYNVLTLKLLKTIQWTARHVKADFFMKADDDSFVRLNVLVRDLAQKEHLGRLYWGFFRGNSVVKKAGPWAEKDWFLCDHYLPYALGGGYVISSDLVKYLNMAAYMLQLYKSEDVSLGTWLAPVQLNRIHDFRFDTEYKSRGCNNNHVVSHKQSVQDMYSKYNQIMKDGTLCEKEHSIRYSFDYNWKVLPSKCCERKRGIP